MDLLKDIYKIYWTVNGEDILLPQTPGSLTISNEDKTLIETLVSGRPFTIAQIDGPQTFKYDFVITQRAYPFTFKDALQGIRYYTDLVWQIKQDRKPIEMTIIRTKGQPSTHVKVLLQDYSYIEDSDDLSDYTFSVTFVAYHPQKNQELQTQETHHLITAGEDTGWSTEVKGAIAQAVGAANNDKQIKEEAQQQRMEQRGV